MLSNVSVDIKNFKSIKAKKICFEKGITLVKGPSGAGKSTALESIVYALTGQPRACKPLGTSAATKVQFDFAVGDGEKWSIVRSTRPGRLVLHRDRAESIEDDEAQSLINTLFGKKFNTVSYIPQNTTKSFMCMTPAAKLEFLETLTFGEEAAVVRNNAKAHLKKMKIQMTKAEAENGVFESELKKYQRMQKLTPVAIPPRPDVEQESLIKKKKEHARSDVKRIENTLIRVNDDKDRLRNKQRARDAAISSCKTLSTEMEEIQECINTDMEEMELDAASSIDACIKDAKDAKDAARKLQRIQSSMPAWAAKGGDPLALTKEWMRAKKLQMDDIARQIKIAEKKDTDVFSCPSCDAHIEYNRMTNTASVASAQPSCGEAASRSSVRELLGEESSLRAAMKRRRREMDTLRENQNIIDNLEDEWGKDTLRDFEELEHALEAVRDLKNKYKRREALRAKYETAKKNADMCDDFDASIRALDTKATTLSKQKKEAAVSFDNADRQIEILEKWKRKVDKSSRINDDVQRQMDALDQATSKRNCSREKMNKVASSLKGAEELKTAVQEAESLALVSIVNRINDHAADYLDAFFPDDPIEVSLRTFTAVKTKKKMKPSIQTEIQFKGNDMKLDGLSGGECARVVVAFNLALNDIMNSPILMMDEVTANLDADLAETIFDTVKASTGQKIVMAVAHQCIDGSFENVLNF
jgi:DNA repair exonuclease SbcCD ATPase subunit